MGKLRQVMSERRVASRSPTPTLLEMTLESTLCVLEEDPNALQARPSAIYI